MPKNIFEEPALNARQSKGEVETERNDSFRNLLYQTFSFLCPEFHAGRIARYLIDSVLNTLNEHGNKITDIDKKKILAAISELKIAVKESAHVEIKTKTDKLEREFMILKEAVCNQLQFASQDEWNFAEIVSENTGDSVLLLTNNDKESKVIREKILENKRTTLKPWHNGKLDSRVFNVSTMPAIREGLANGKVYELVADPEIVKGINEGTLNYTRNNLGLMTTVKNTKSGKFAGTAALKESTQSLIKMPIIAWQILHIVVSTSELNKINKRLDNLQRSLDDLNFRQESTIEGKVRSAIERLEDIVLERNETGNFTTDMKNRLNSIEEVIGSIYHRNKILIDRFRNDATKIQELRGKEGATQAQDLLLNNGSQADNDMKMLTSLAIAQLKIEYLKILYYREHNVNFLDIQMKKTNEKVVEFQEVISNFPSLESIKEHAQECVNEMGWWSKNVFSRGLIKNIKDLGDSNEFPPNEIPHSEFMGGKYVIFNDECGKTQTYILPQGYIEI